MIIFMTEFYPDSPQFELPEGFLDGSEFEIAHRWIDGRHADLVWHLDQSPVASEESVHASMAVLDRYRERLAQGDESLAAALSHQATEEADELRAGRRYTVSGQAHLFRTRASIANPDLSQ
jgi:hypothetical protein